MTFSNPLDTYTPYALASLGTDIIAPFWADVDTRPAGSLVMTFGNNLVNGHRAFGVSWLDVGYFELGADKLNTFQLVLIHRRDRGDADFDIEFNYGQIEWEAGDVSGGAGGIWVGPEGAPARAGYANASGTSFEFAGSGIGAGLLDSNATTG